MTISKFIKIGDRVGGDDYFKEPASGFVVDSTRDFLLLNNGRAVPRVNVTSHVFSKVARVEDKKIIYTDWTEIPRDCYLPEAKAFVPREQAKLVYNDLVAFIKTGGFYDKRGA